MKSCLIVYNQHSGKNNKLNFIENIKQVLIEHEYLPTVMITKYKGHAMEIVEQASWYDLLISIGGDGTFNEVMTGNLRRSNRLLVSHIPLGTANDIGAMYGFGKDIIQNLKMVLSGTIKKVDICLINKQPFVYVAGLGKFVNISYETPRELKKKFGYLAYLIEGLKEFRGKTKRYDIEYEINGNVYSGKYSFMLISNANRIAGIDNFYKSVKLDDNIFEVLLCDLTTKADIVKSLYYLTTKDITQVPGFYFYRTNKFIVRFSEVPKKSWSIDGEKLDSTETEYCIEIESGISLLLPNKNIEKLFTK